MANTISDELNRLIQAKAGIKSALEEKGLTIGDSSTLDEFPGLIQEMEVGGGGVDTSTLIDLIEGDLTTLVIPEGTTKIGQSAFQNRKQLSSVTIPSNISNIDMHAFAGCSALHSLDLPAACTTIYNGLVRDCVNLEKFVIKAGVTDIWNEAFYNVSTGMSLAMLPTVPPTLHLAGNYIFGGSWPIYVKASAVNTYKNAGGNWDNVSTRIQPLAAIDYDSSTMTVTASGRDNVELYIDSSLIDSSVYTFTPGTEDSSHVITVKSVDPSLGVLDTSTMEVLIEAESPNYFGLTAVQDASVGLTGNKNVDLKYSSDGKNWTAWDYANETLNLPAGNTLYFKGNNPQGLSSNTNQRNKFILNTGKVNAFGNIQSLLYDDNFVDNNTINWDGCFRELFSDCTSLTTAPELPATTLTVSCYANMFSGCTSLTTAPELPATTLTQSCYAYMFAGCTSLTTAPELPATLLSSQCYSNMFNGCTSLTTAPDLYNKKYYNQCCQNMFYGCSSLTTAPIITGNIVSNNSGQFNNMFGWCKNLNYIKIMLLDEPSLQYMFEWVNKVSSTGTFVMNADATWDPEEYRGVNGIPEGWTVEKVTA